MADSKLANDANNSLMIAAASWRVKCRKTFNKEGTDYKIRCRPGELGVNKGNRGGDYPNGVRVEELLRETAKLGILQEEADHNCIAVQEMPLEEMRQRPDHETSLAYNIRQCARDERLHGVYDAPFNIVNHTMLSHNHFMTVCRAFLTKRAWNTAAIPEKSITFCDKSGKLSLTLFTATPNGAQLAVIIEQGFLCEVLAWEMDVQEPTAAVVISTAANEVNAVAMRTTELQAFKGLKGEIIIQMGKDVTQAVVFQTIVERVKAQLGPAVAGPGLIEIFDFLISNGVGKNSYVDDFMDWTDVFVNGKLRQLRFMAFCVINKMANVPASRIAVGKRAYRGRPTNGVCPNPEHAWSQFTLEQLTPLEELLRFFHVQCSELLSKLTPDCRLKLLGEVDIAAAEAFLLVMNGGRSILRANYLRSETSCLKPPCSLRKT